MKIPMVYYNEIDPHAAAWLRELIKQGLIAPGDVDERSIIDVKPADLMGYDQCHFFAGIGVWSYALRQAGWPDDKPVWTGSCPCQPFSTAGKGRGKKDERHLWPEMFRLIGECKPDAVFGEQVGSKAGIDWLDDVQTDLERAGYTSGAVTFPACSIGSPHQRQRTYWVAQSELHEHKRKIAGGAGIPEAAKIGNRKGITFAGQSGGANTYVSSGMANSVSESSKRGTGGILREKTQVSSKGEFNGDMRVGLANDGEDGGLADNNEAGSQRRLPGREDKERENINGHAGRDGSISRPAPTNGIWRDVDWLYCRDGKWRPVEPGTFPLANGAAERVGRLRGYGNAIVAEQAKIFIETAGLAFRELTGRVK